VGPLALGTLLASAPSRIAIPELCGVWACALACRWLVLVASQAVGSYQSVKTLCDNFDAETATMLSAVGGDKYATVAQLTYRYEVRPLCLRVCLLRVRGVQRFVFGGWLSGFLGVGWAVTCRGAPYGLLRRVGALAPLLEGLCIRFVCVWVPAGGHGVRVDWHWCAGKCGQACRLCMSPARTRRGSSSRRSPLAAACKLRSTYQLQRPHCPRLCQCRCWYRHRCCDVHVLFRAC
jgi:hypothetical protein